MSQEQADKKSEKKPLPVMLILQILFAVVNLGIVGGGAYLTYISTLGWRHPSITERSLRAAARKVASVNTSKEKGQEEAAAPAEGEKAEASVAHGASEHDAGPLLYKLEKFTVNLEGSRMISLEVNFELLNEESFEEVMEITKLPKIRDRIVAILNEKNFSDIESLQGKLFLKDRIASEVNGLLDEGVVKDVYFSEFVVR